MKIPDLGDVSDALDCPSCGRPVFVRSDRDYIRCASCGIRWDTDGTNGRPAHICRNASCEAKIKSLIKKYGDCSDGHTGKQEWHDGKPYLSCIYCWFSVPGVSPLPPLSIVDE